MLSQGFSATALHDLTDLELLDQLTAADHQLGLLQQEVRRRMQRRAKVELRMEQHAEISRMVEHLEQSKVDWQQVREFFSTTIAEAQDRWM